MSNASKPRQQNFSYSSNFSGVPITNYFEVSVAGVLLQELELKHLRCSVVLRHSIGDVRQATLVPLPEALVALPETLVAEVPFVAVDSTHLGRDFPCI